MKEKGTEQGQVLVLILLAVVGLMGFAALAVDGGLIYAERRRAQNAADASAYAAARAAVQGQDFISAGINQASLNDYVNDGVSNTVTVHNPPISGPNKNNADYYQVVIHSWVSPVFSQFVFNGPLEITTEAVTRGEGTDGPTDGNAVHALTPTGEGVEFKGNVKVEIIGGNVYSNANGKKAGGSGDVEVIGGDIISRGSWSGYAGISPVPMPNQPAQTIRKMPIPDCNIDPGTINTTTKKITPGTFPNGIHLHAQGVWTMEKGMYCIKGGLTVNGGVELHGKDVFIVMQTGEIKLNGNGAVYLTRPDAYKDKSDQEWGGTLIYVLPTNPNKVFLSGGNRSIFAGTIYAPSSLCEVGGNAGAVGYKSNIICNQVKFHGSAKITLDYKEPQNLRLAPIVELTQ
jgi:hypothetical protein